MKIIDERDFKKIHYLEDKMLQFYRTTNDYTAFQKTSDYPVIWSLVKSLAEEIKMEKDQCRVLEIGAGRSGFGKFIEKTGRKGIFLTSQDITDRNSEELEKYSDEVIFKNINELNSSWDIIFHTYVLEHLIRPKEFIRHIYNLLNYNGYHVIQSPRYDIPFYCPPAMDHLSRLEKNMYSFHFLLQDVLPLSLYRKETFAIFSDPAVFHLPFFRDRDAVHRVSKKDIILFHKDYGSCKDYHLPWGGLKDCIVKKFLTLRIIIKKTVNKRIEATEIGSAR